MKMKYRWIGALLLICFSILLSGCDNSGGTENASSERGFSIENVSQINDVKILDLDQVEQVIESGPFELKKREAPDWLTYTAGVVADDEQKPEPVVYDIVHEDLGQGILMIFVFDDHDVSLVKWAGDESSAGGIPITGKNVSLQIVSEQMSPADEDMDFDEFGRLLIMEDELRKVLCEKAFGGKTVVYQGESGNLSAELEMRDYQTTDGHNTNYCSYGLVKIRLKNEDLQINDIQKISAEGSNASALFAEANETAKFIASGEEYIVLSVDRMQPQYSLQITYLEGEREEIIITSADS